MSLRLRIIRHGPNDERGFGLIVGLVAAIAVVALAVLIVNEAVDQSWLVVALSAFGLLWLFGPLLMPGVGPILQPEWFRLLPYTPSRIARYLAPSEMISVGTCITLVALTSLTVVATKYGIGIVTVSIVAIITQLYFLVWLGRLASVATARLLRTTAGAIITAFQMSTLLAVSFAGWVPIAAVVLPDLGQGDTSIVTPETPGAVPSIIENGLSALPTGWGVASVTNAIDRMTLLEVTMPIVGLLIGGMIFQIAWVALTAYTLRQPPARTESNIRARPHIFSQARPNSAVWAVVVKELHTWFRDPHRRLRLWHAWLTPLLMILIIAPTGWSWALPFIGIAAATLAGMVAVNTYSLDGTALWQLLTTPKSLAADVWGRQIALLLLLGIPIIIGTIILAIISQSAFGIIAVSITIFSLAFACVTTTFTSLLIPSIGSDARERISLLRSSGNATGAEYTVCTAIIAAAIAYGFVVSNVNLDTSWFYSIAISITLGLGVLLGLTPLVVRYIGRAGSGLLLAMIASDNGRR
ncbi:hypothetical protein EON76_03220 [bacterium]|nr:MAG: hypothetical protein EON76_03220 [bacterium]